MKAVFSDFPGILARNHASVKKMIPLIQAGMARRLRAGEPYERSGFLAAPPDSNFSIARRT